MPVTAATPGGILAVVVSYGHTPQLPRLVRSLAAVAGARVVLVENKPGTAHPWVPDGVQLLSGHGNLGYGAAVNYAVAIAAGGGPLAEWLLVANGDAAVPPLTAVALPGLLASTTAAAVGFPVHTSSGHPARSAAVLPTVATSLYTAVRGEQAAVTRWPHLRYPPGAFFAVRTQAFLGVGGFDTRYFLYWEETALFDDLFAAGHDLVWVPPLWPVVHDGAGSTGHSGVLDVEFGRGAAVYARTHRASTGVAWPAAYATQLAALACRKTATGRYGCAARAVRILAGLAAGHLAPGWEPAARPPWRAAPAAERVRLGNLPGHARIQPSTDTCSHGGKLTEAAPPVRDTGRQRPQQARGGLRRNGGGHVVL